MRAVKAIDQYLVPAVESDLVEGQHQIFPNPGITQRVGALGGHQDVQILVMLERIDANVYQQQDFTRYARAQQNLFGHHPQRHRDAALQRALKIEQLEFGQVAAAGVQCQTRAAVDHVVTMAPGKQLQQFAAALDRRERLPLMDAEIAVVQAPLILAGFAFIGRLHQRQRVLGQIRRDARIDELDLARLALECRIKTTP